MVLHCIIHGYIHCTVQYSMYSVGTYIVNIFGHICIKICTEVLLCCQCYVSAHLQLQYYTALYHKREYNLSTGFCMK